METEDVPPDAHLFESMRAVGYSLATAISDVVDNSIAASASEIRISFDGGAAEPFIVVLDNGLGMSRSTARGAMQLAGTSALAERSSSDLGRFGLGLKTASLSQCRRLTVLTKTYRGSFVAYRWDLDHLAITREWSLLVMDETEAAGLPGYEAFSKLDSGTLVVWELLDTLSAQSRNLSAYLDAQMVDVESHLALVFHRFIGGDGVKRARISVNGNEVDGIDPFLSKSTRTQASPVESIDIGGSSISVQAYTLPLISTMTVAERKRATTNGDLRDSQGFYVYRGGRLVVWGTWFRLIPRAEMSKLTRVKVDIPNTLDHLWSLDIKKSSAVPPAVVRERLRTLAGTLVHPSERVHRYRGRAVADDSVTHAWNLIDDRGGVRYEINRDHPSLRLLGEALDSGTLRHLEDAVSMLEIMLPVHDIHNRMSSDTVVSNAVPTPDNFERVREALWMFWTLSSGNEEAGAFLDRMLHTEPFTLLESERDALFVRMNEPTGSR